MSSGSVTRTGLSALAGLAGVLPRAAELSRATAAQAQMEGLLAAAKKAAAAGDHGQLTMLAAEAERLGKDFAAGCGVNPGREARAVIALASDVKSWCEKGKG